MSPQEIIKEGEDFQKFMQEEVKCEDCNRKERREDMEIVRRGIDRKGTRLCGECLAIFESAEMQEEDAMKERHEEDETLQDARDLEDGHEGSLLNLAEGHII